MAEVGQRLGGGVYRLSALRSGQSRPVRTGQGPGALLARCAGSDSGSRAEEEPARDQREAQPVSSGGAARRKSEKVSRVRKSKHQQENASLPRAPSLELCSSRFVGFVYTNGEQAHGAALLHLAASLQPLLRERLLPRRMTPWTRGAVSIHPDTLRSPQQHRALCTVVFVLAEQGSERPGGGQRARRAKPHPDPGSMGARNYSRGSDGSGPLLHRSRTAYYDTLKVSPGATQSQIKTAYYRQSFIHHPDRNPGSEDATRRFSEISEAYTVLGNVSLRKMYDNGVLNQSDLQGTGRPSSKEATSRSAGSQHQHQHQYQHHRDRRFDYEAFYRAHYGEQLQREREMRARREYMQKERAKNLEKWREINKMEALALLLATAGLAILTVTMK